MTDRIHVLIAANEEDAMGYAWDPEYTHIKYVGNPKTLRGLRCDEVSFTPRATMQPDWMEALVTMQNNLTKSGDGAPGAGWRGKVHYISLFDQPEQGADASQEEQ